MTIEKITEGAILTVRPGGRMDTITAPEVDKALKDVPEAITSLVLDMEKVEYISSSGLRVLLAAKKNYPGKDYKLINVHPDVMTILEMTGFTGLLKIE